MEKTEYFITYWRVEYPACRQVSAQNVVQVQEQQAKACFKPEDCPDNRFITSFANFSNIEKQLRKCPQGLAEDCPDYTECKGKRPYTCIGSDFYCPESSHVADCRCSVGELTPKVKEIFVGKLPNIVGKYPDLTFNCTGNPSNFTSIVGGKLPGFTLHSKAEIDLSSIDAKIGHGELIRKYNKLKTGHPKPEHVQFIEDCQDIAATIVEVVGDEPNASIIKNLRQISSHSPLPTDGKSNDEWVVLPEFSKQIGKPQKYIKIYFMQDRSPDRITVGQNEYGKCAMGYMGDCIWGQVREGMTVGITKPSYFIWKVSIPDVISALKEEKKKNIRRKKEIS